MKAICIKDAMMDNGVLAFKQGKVYEIHDDLSHAIALYAKNEQSENNWMTKDGHYFKTHFREIGGSDEVAASLKRARELISGMNKDIPLLKSGKNGAIELDPNNPSHREWYENDEYYDV